MSLELFVRTILGKYSPALLVLIISAFRRDSGKRALDFVTAIGLILYIMIGLRLLGFTSAHTLDPVFLHADQALGLNPLQFANEVLHHRTVCWILLIAYQCLPFAVVVAWLWEQDLQFRRAALIGGIACFGFYFMLPAVGPLHFDWAHNAPLPQAPDNCMPSMHFTWALLIALNVRRGIPRALFSGYAALIAVATIGLGEHYVVDLLAAVPYTLAVQFAAKQLGRRSLSIQSNAVASTKALTDTP